MERRFVTLTLIGLLSFQCSSGFPSAWRKTLNQKAATGYPVSVQEYLTACGVDSIPRVNSIFYNRDKKLWIGHLRLTDDVGIYSILPTSDDEEVKDLSPRSEVGLQVTYHSGKLMDVWHWHFSQKKKTDEKRYWYFDRSAWNQYIRDQLGASVLIPDDGAAPDALKHYIILLGLMGLNRYGWISLEGTWWSPQRAAIVTLVNHRELNVIRMLLRAPNIEGRAYAVDALMYLEYLGHPMTTEDRRIIDKMHEDNEQIKAESLMGEDPPRVLRFNEIFTERYTDILPIWYKTINERIAYYESVYLFP